MIRLCQTFFVLLALVCVSTSAYSSSESAAKALLLGEIELINVGTVIRVAVGDDEVISTSVLENGSLMVIPLKAGNSELLVWTLGERLQRYQVSVFSADMKTEHALVSSILSNFRRVEVRITEGFLVVEGEIDPIETQQFDTALGQLSGVINLVKTVPEKRQMVRMKVQVIEVDKRYRKDLGINWDDSSQGPIVGTIGTLVNNPAYRIFPQNDLVNWEQVLGLIPPSDKTFYPYSGLATTITSRIDFLQENGAGRILAEPTLTTRSGEQASFLAGGELPYPLTDQNGQTTVQFREYGIRLEIEPIVDRTGNITSIITAEVSSIDPAVTVLGVPGILTRETESTINIRAGETIAISGLLSTSDTKNIESVPLLGEIPILGALFRSQSFQEQRTEIVFLVTTEVVEPDTMVEASETLLKSLKHMYEVKGTGGHFADKLID